MNNTSATQKENVHFVCMEAKAYHISYACSFSVLLVCQLEGSVVWPQDEKMIGCPRSDFRPNLDVSVHTSGRVLVRSTLYHLESRFIGLVFL